MEDLNESTKCYMSNNNSQGEKSQRDARYNVFKDKFSTVEKRRTHEEGEKNTA